MTRDGLKAIVDAVTRTTDLLLVLSEQRVSNTSDGDNLRAIASHLGLTATRDALESLMTILNSDQPLHETQLGVLATVANRIGDAGRATFPLGDAEPVPGKDKRIPPVDATTCSFCGKSAAERPLIRGPGVAICDQCVAQARRLLK